MKGPRLAQLLSDQDEELDILGMPRKKRRMGYIGNSPQYKSLEEYYQSKTPQEIFSQYTPSAPPPLNLQTPEPRPLDQFASVEGEYTPYRPDKPIGPPTGAPTAPPLDPRDYRQAVIKDEPARPLFSGMLPQQFPEAYQIGYTPPTPNPPAAVAPSTPEAPVTVNPDAERLAAALQAQQQQQAQMMAAQAEMQRQAEIQRQMELARLEEERRRQAQMEAAGVDDGGGR